MKRRAKILVLTAILVLVALSACACGRMDFVYRQNLDGTYTHMIDIALDEQSTLAGYSLAEAIDALKGGLQKNGYTVETYDDNRVVAVKTFQSVDELHTDVLGNGLLTLSYKDDDKGFFEYRTIYGLPRTSPEYIKTYQAWLQGILSLELSARGAAEVAAAMTAMDTSYAYVTPYKSVESDADIKVQEGSYYIHKWNLDGEQQNVTITISHIRGALWYGVAIVAAVAVTAIFAVAKVLSGKYRKKKAVKD